MAIKVLREPFAKDPDRLARFQREAEVLASLNHQNIAAIYGIERSQAMPALVMELVEGPTLADHIARGPVLLDQALPITTQIIAALEVAHESGIVHRDLKPSNIKVRPDGTVKVLDFGIAKAVQAGRESGDGTSTTALTVIGAAPMTGTGMILGTAAYMSPEQAMGQSVDARTDIWALGCVMYEALTGRSPFAGDSGPASPVCRVDIDAVNLRGRRASASVPASTAGNHPRTLPLSSLTITYAPGSARRFVHVASCPGLTTRPSS